MWIPCVEITSANGNIVIDIAEICIDPKWLFNVYLMLRVFSKHYHDDHLICLWLKGQRIDKLSVYFCERSVNFACITCLRKHVKIFNIENTSPLLEPSVRMRLLGMLACVFAFSCS